MYLSSNSSSAINKRKQLGNGPKTASNMEWMFVMIAMFVFFGISSLHYDSSSKSVETTKLTKFSASSTVRLQEQKLISNEVGIRSNMSYLDSLNTFSHSILEKYFEEKTTFLSYLWKERQSMKAQSVSFRGHLAHSFANSIRTDLLLYMQALANHASCQEKPLFVTMAQVRSDLYWQLIENFFHSMAAFGHLDCTVLICVSDDLCNQRCKDNDFPCFKYEHTNSSAHIMEQVAELKLFHMGRALEAGMNIFLLDLDVGFLRDPLLLYKGFLENPYEQVRAQMDVGTTTDKVTNTWVTNPRPNFGVFLVKSHPHSIKAFQRAWREYLKSSEANKQRVATDQNAIVNALKWARWRWDFNFTYYHLGYLLDTYPRPILMDLEVHLLDHMYKLNPANPMRMELGGEAAREELGPAIAVHATCHEGSTKLQGLKAANAFWNSNYYDPSRRTLTKPVMALSRRQLQDELRALGYLAVRSNRTLIVPNVILGVGTNVKGQKTLAECKDIGFVSPFCQEIRNSRNRIAAQDQTHAALHRGEFYWPAWRTLYEDLPELEVVEPSFYYRMQSDMRVQPPRAATLRFDLSGREQHKKEDKLDEGRDRSTGDVAAEPEANTGENNVGSSGLSGFRGGQSSGLSGFSGGQSSGSRSAGESEGSARGGDLLEQLLLRLLKFEDTRVVIDLIDLELGKDYRGGPQDLSAWTEDSVSSWGDGVVPKHLYIPLPPVAPLKSAIVSSTEKPLDTDPSLALSADIFRTDSAKYRLCRTFLMPTVGNRTCFAKCK